MQVQHRIRTDVLRGSPALRRIVEQVFGQDEEPLAAVADRARDLLPDLPVVVWEADPLTFNFTSVSAEVEPLLGYPAARWQEPGFWKSQVVHPEDLPDAISHCALATAAGTDHDFEYRARTAGGDVLLVHDVVHVLKGPLGFANCLRGLMFPVAEAAAPDR